MSVELCVVSFEYNYMSEDKQYNEYILRLISKLKTGEATQDEIKEIDRWYDQPHSLKKYSDGLSQFEKAAAKQRIFQNILLRIKDEHRSSPKRTLGTWVRYGSVAAILLVVMSIGLYHLLPKSDQPVPSNEKVSFTVQPGGHNATLTLANGRQILLNNVKDGVLANQGNTVVTKSGNNQVSYNTGATPSNKVEYNKMSTLSGGEYQLTLSDGTKVWLNAASDIIYPTSFVGNERVVKVAGEAYFEVAHNASKPFKVISNGQTVEVLGTHFNINSYINEPQMKTTLLQGSVKIVANGKNKILKPGQQALVSHSDLTVTNVDAEEAVAWKEGYFEFTDADIETVMRELARWYDVDVIFEGKVPAELFTGRVSKYLNLNQVLNLIKSPKIHISTNGRRIMIKG